MTFSQEQFWMRLRVFNLKLDPKEIFYMMGGLVKYKKNVKNIVTK